MNANSREAPAKAGIKAQSDVWIPSGSTGLDPKQTAFFQQLNIATKISRSVIEIISDTKVINQGELVEPSHAVLLDKLNIMPFVYRLEADSVIDNGAVFPPEVLDITSASIIQKYQKALSYVAAASVEAGLPNQASARHSIMNAFKNLVAVTYTSEYSFPQAEELKNAAAAGPAAPADDKPVKKEKEEAPEPVEVMIAPAFMNDDEDEY
jgi:large subunit ribosomal protein LP0